MSGQGFVLMIENFFSAGNVPGGYVILIIENICRPKCITSERIGSVEQKAANKCVHEYSIHLTNAARVKYPAASLIPCCWPWDIWLDKMDNEWALLLC